MISNSSGSGGHLTSIIFFVKLETNGQYGTHREGH